jgi:N-acyl-D-amino-acid deacylase
MADVLLRGGLVVDGSGAPSRQADVAIEGERVSAIGDLASMTAAVDVDASGLVVAPGFVDTHAHSDGVLLWDPQHANGVQQGITTEIIAQDGLSYAPLGAEDFRMYRRYLSGLLGLPPDDLDMSSIAAAREHYDGKACNVVQLVPHGAVRISTAGFHDTPLRGDLLATADGIVRQGIADGARGFSTGLSYYPNSYSDSDELIALNTAVAEAGGVYVVHVRNHNDDRAPYGSGITEALEIGRRSGVKVHVSHYRTQPSTAGEVEELMTEIDAAKQDGVDVSLECYPYPAGSTVPGYFLPGEFHEGGPDAMLARLDTPEGRKAAIDAIGSLFPGALEGAAWTWLASEANKGLGGMSFADVAAQRGVSIEEMTVDVMIEERLACGFRYIPPSSIAIWRQVEADVMALLARDDYMIGSDSIPLGETPHPRAYGTFPRVVGRLRRRLGYSLEQVVNRVTGLPASRFGLTDRGVLREGAFADIVVFDADQIADLASFEDPTAPPVGIPHVLVNGTFVVRDGGLTGALPGRVVP